MRASDYRILATSERYREAITFWRARLANADELAGASHVGARASGVGAATPASHQRIQLPIELRPPGIAAIDAVASDDLGCFTVIIAGIALAVSRYADCAGALLRTPLAIDGAASEGTAHDSTGGRSNVDGLNESREVPLAFSLDAPAHRGDAATIRDWLGAAATTVEDSYAFQDFPISTLAREDCGHELDALGIGVRCSAIHGPAAPARSPIELVIDLASPLSIRIEADPAIAERFVLDGLASVIADTLDRFTDLSTRIGDIPRLPEPQRERVLSAWNRTDVHTPFASVHALFEQRARATPEATAIRWGAESISYRELNARANGIARELRANGAGRDLQDVAVLRPPAIVGIWMNRSPAMVASIFGVLKAGCAYLPIDADLPLDRVAFLLSDAGARVVLASRGQLGAAASLGCAAIVPDDIPAADDVESTPDVSPSDLAYVIYTSGSTGVPKGCAIEHHSLTNYVRWANDFYWTSPDAGSMALFTPLSFDLTVPSVFCPLLRGRTLTIFPQDLSIQDALAQQFAPDSGIDSVKLTPSHIRVLESAYPALASSAPRPDLATSTDVRLAIVGGEALTPQHVAVLHRIDPRIRVVNEYGPTEATVGCVAYDVTPGEPIVIGRPIANTQAYVLDGEQRPLAIGMRGELCIGGEGVARGYLQRPALEAERFLPNPFVRGGRIYRTGDIARWLPNGTLECFGRVDHQLKVRGFRIEPGEVERAIREVAGVREALVVSDDDALVAYVVSDEPIDATAFRESLLRRLPSYMTPSAFIGLAALPLTPNGKVDRTRLPRTSSVAQARGAHVPPRGATETALARIWEDLFNVRGVGATDDFYALGGHSLRAMTVAQRVHDALGVEMSIGELLSHPTIAALAAIIDSRAPTTIERIPRVADADHYAVSHGQRRLWMIDRIEGPSAAYNVSSAFVLHGAVDREALSAAFRDLIARHESLRTVFVDIDEEPRQKILGRVDVPIDVIDWRGDADRDARLGESVMLQASTPFDLAAGPLLRVGVYQLEDARAVLSLTLHHIVSDAWSMRILMAELAALYEDRLSSSQSARMSSPAPASPVLLPPVIHYRDYAAWQREQLNSGALADARTYWRTKLAGDLPALDVPADLPRPPVPSYEGRHFNIRISEEATAELRQLAVAHGASTFMALVAIVKALLYRYAGRDAGHDPVDIRVGSPIAGRTHPDTTNVIGFFVNTLVLRDTVDGAEPFTALLRRVKRTAEEAYEHQAFPFDLIVEELDVARDLSRSPLFDVMVVHDRDDANGGAVKSRAAELRLDSGVSKFDLTFAFQETSDRIDVEIEYRTDLFSNERIALIASQLVEFASEVAKSASMPIGAIPITGLSKITAARVPGTSAPRAVTAHDAHQRVAPRNDRELSLIGVLESVLGRRDISVTANFFHVGGDSIKAIQTVNRLGRVGWTLRVRDIFEAPRIDELARRMTSSQLEQRSRRKSTPAEGDVPLTPIQRWFFHTQPEHRAHFNQSVLLRFRERVNESGLRAVVRAIIAEHASLRLRFDISPSTVRQSYVPGSDPAGSGSDPTGSGSDPGRTGSDPVEVHDLRSVADPSAAMERLAAEAQSALDLEAGRLVKVMLFQLPHEDRLLVVIHHLAIDGVSWRILFDDLRLGLSQAVRGETVALAESTDSYQAWARALDERAHDAESESSWWHDVDAASGVALPFDAVVADSREADLEQLEFFLDADDTSALAGRVHRAYNTRMPDVLIAAFAVAMRDWAGDGPLKIDIESHGRDSHVGPNFSSGARGAAHVGPNFSSGASGAGTEVPAYGGDDVSRTVGWFTSLYPVVVDIAREPDPGRALVSVKDSLGRTPGNGIGYGLLRNGAPSGADILFNFLGQFDTDIAGLELADEDRGPEIHPAARVTHALTVGGWISDGRLHVTLRFSRRRFHSGTIERLAEGYRRALVDLIAHCLSRVAHARNARDFRSADPAAMALANRLGTDRVDDVYALSPMQLGILYHAALEADPHRIAPSGVYIETFSYAITGPLDVHAFRSAWEQVIARHDALRTAVFWRDLAQPLQVVFSQVDVPWTFIDWRELSGPDQAARIEAFIDEDRRRPLAVDAAPLMRFALIRLRDEAYRFVWTAHHLILDGWSTAIVVEEVMAAYQAAAESGAVTATPAPQFGAYIDWLRAQDQSAAAAHWRALLHDFATPTPLPGADRRSADTGRLATAELRLTREHTASIEETARTNGLTLNTVTRGVWALLLASHAGRNDVVFGATIAGRPADLLDVESMVGLFINTLPVRARISPSSTTAAWLHRLQLEQAALEQFSFSALADVQRASGVPSRTALFDSVLVFENYPVDRSGSNDAAVAVEELPAIEHTNYPLTLIAGPGDELTLRLSYDTAFYTVAAARGLLTEMAAMFDAIAHDPHVQIDALLSRSSGIAPRPRHRFEPDARSMAAVRALAERGHTDIETILGALVFVLAFRYSVHEDLRCGLGDRLLLCELLSGDGSVDDATATFIQTSNATHPPEGAPFDLAFDVARREADGPRIIVRSDTGRFDAAFLERVEQHFKTLAESAAAHPHHPILRLPLMPDAERRRVLDEFNDTARDWGAERTIVEYFEDHAAAHPDRVALRLPSVDADGRWQDETWTYGELNARANQWAHRLVREHGVGPGVRVGVLAERSFEMVMALVAIEKAGGAYVPLDPDYPVDLLHFMMQDSGAAAILAQQRFVHLADGSSAPVIALDSGDTAGDENNLPSRVSGDDVAYVIYTSGSTGRPKGAMNTHRAIANRLLWMQEAYGLTATDRVLQKTPFSFDVSVWEFFWPLMAGAELVIAKPGGHRDAAYLVALIEHARITTLHFVPSMLQAFIEEPGVARCDSLLRVICSGEAVTTELLRRYLERVRAPLHNLYGPTEAAVDVTAWPLTHADTTSMVPIGRPIANIQLYVLHVLPGDHSTSASAARFQPAPLGVTGELFIGGVGVGLGYLNRDELTADKFIPDPFRPAPGARLYRTGDLARFRDDGVVDFLGRIDHQVKLRGFRIELGEVEAALLSHPAIRECVAMLREDQPGMKRLVAYVVLSEGTEVPATVAPHLNARLASHMIPSVIVPLEELPRLTNGKLDRKALPVPEERVTNARRYVAPRDSVERRLERVWSEVLGQTAIGVTDDFFERGGHSILAMRLVSAMHIEFGRALPLAQLLAHPTIERLAVALKSGGTDLDDWRPLVELRRGDTSAPLFLLPGAGGNVVYFHALASQLTTTRPIYALQAIGLDGHTPPLATIEAIAAANIEEMRRAWPDGPYLVAGHSFGGRVALEMSQQLVRAGQRVAVLGVLDTAAPVFEPTTHEAHWSDAQWLAKIAREIEEFFGIDLAVRLDDLTPLGADEQLAFVASRMERAGAWAPGADLSQLRGYLRVYKAHTQAAFVRYGDDPARVPIALFKAREKDADATATPSGLSALNAEADWGWHRFALGPVQIYDVPGAHLSMLTPPHVTELARALDAALRSVRGRA